MDEVTKQSLLDLLTAAKGHIEGGEHAEAIEKINDAIATLENEGVATASEDGDGKKPNKPKPLPGQGTNGGFNP